MFVLDQGFKFKYVYVFLDGFSFQFKNRYMVNFYYKFRLEDMNFIWYFFVMLYGKGVVDGIGGIVKRVVWRVVFFRRVLVVVDVVFFVKVVFEMCKVVKINFISFKELDRFVDLLDFSICF